jgi:hypothetical protein
MLNPKIKVRLQILHDAWLATFAEEVTVQQGAYLQVEPRGSDRTVEIEEIPDLLRAKQPCTVCLLGAMALNLIMQQEPRITCGSLVLPPLRTYFDTRTLAVAEALFEGQPILISFGSFWDAQQEECRGDDGCGFLGDEICRIVAPWNWIRGYTRARFILNHMIENEGSVHLPSFEEETKALMEVDVSTVDLSKALEFTKELTPKAKEALKRHGIIKEENDG